MAVSENPQKPEGFDDKVENLNFMKRNVPHRYEETIDEIKLMAGGSTLEGIRGKYYPGWENSDFEDLLSALGEV